MALTVAHHPVRTAADAHALSAADAAVIIVRTGATTRRRLAGAVEDLAAQRITIVGAVLFDLDPDDVGQSIRTYRAAGAATS